MKIPPVKGWKAVRVKHPVAIPTLDGKSVAETIHVEVDAWKNADGDIFLDGDAHEKIDAIKSRHMGLLTPEELKDIRVSKLQATQKQISSWLQIGEKTWTRWESGRERPSRSMNVLLCALRDGKISAQYLEGLRLGEKLSKLAPQEQLARTVTYHTPRERSAYVRSLLRKVDSLRNKGEATELAYLEEHRRTTRPRKSGKTRFVSFAVAAKAHQQSENVWQICSGSQHRSERAGAAARINLAELLSA